MITDPTSPLATKIAELDARLVALEQQIEEIGMPAGQELRERLEALKVQERALKRNLTESFERGEPDAHRLAQIEALFAHIEEEESLMEENTHFLTQAAPSSVTIVAEAAAKTLALWQRALRKVVGDHHPFGASAFVNHNHDDLVRGNVSEANRGQ
ncbi:MAG: hypothetical protein V4733_07540 [Verrucomicrobiota bacterium]